MSDEGFLSNNPAPQGETPTQEPTQQPVQAQIPPHQELPQSQAITSDWHTLVGEYANDPNISKFKDPRDLAKSYIEAQKLIGREKVPIPKDQAELQEVLTKLGVPDKATAYPNFDDATSVFGSAQDFEAFKEIAHESGLLPQQFTALYGKVKEMMQNDSANKGKYRQEMTAKGLQQLATDFGTEADAKLNTARRVFQIFSDDVKQQITAAGLDVNANFIKSLASLGEYYKEDSFIATRYSGSEAKSELQAITSNRAHPYYNKEHPEHTAAVQKVQTLYKIVYGG